MLKRYLETGKIVATQGLKGEVRVEPWCDGPEFLAQFEGFFLGEGTEFLRIQRVRAAKNVAVVKFEGTDTVEAARKLIRRILYIDRNWVELPEGSYFEQDLLGLKVVDDGTGENYGTLISVDRTGANDVYTVDCPDGRQVLIPAIREVVRSVKLEEGKMRITPLRGLFDDED